MTPNQHDILMLLAVFTVFGWVYSIAEAVRLEKLERRVKLLESTAAALGAPQSESEPRG